MPDPPAVVTEHRVEVPSCTSWCHGARRADWDRHEDIHRTHHTFTARAVTPRVSEVCDLPGLIVAPPQTSPAQPPRQPLHHEELRGHRQVIF